MISLKDPGKTRKEIFPAKSLFLVDWAVTQLIESFWFLFSWLFFSLASPALPVPHLPAPILHSEWVISQTQNPGWIRLLEIFKHLLGSNTKPLAVPENFYCHQWRGKLDCFVQKAEAWHNLGFIILLPKQWFQLDISWDLSCSHYLSNVCLC